MMHETPSRDPGDGRATGQPQGLGPEAYLSVRRRVSLSSACRRNTRGRPASGWAKRSDAGGRVVCGAKHIRSLYLSLVRERPPGLSTTSPPKGPASISTISAATMRLCKADLPAVNNPIAAGSRSHSVPPHRAYSSERRTARSAVAAGDSCIVRPREPASAPHALPLRSTVRALDDKGWRSLGRRVTRRAEKPLASVAPSRYNRFRLDGTKGRLAPCACIRGKAYEQEVF